MSRLFLLTPGALSRDPRAGRAVAAGQAHGLEVVVLCEEPTNGPNGPSHPQAVADTGTVRPVRTAHIRPGRLTTALRASRLGGSRRSRPLLRELRGVYRLARLVRTTAAFRLRGRKLATPTIVHSNDFETLPAGFLIARASGARLVYDAHEIYSDQEPDAPRLHRALTSALEGLLSRRADSVVTVSEGIASDLQRTLRLRRPPLVVLNCPPRAPLVDPGPVPGPLRAVYQGAMGPGRQLEDLLEAAAHSADATIAIRVVGLDLAALRAEIVARGVQHVALVLDPVPPADLVTALAEFDVGLIINRPVTRNDELVFPNKLFEYMMAGLAVVAPRLPISRA